MAEKQKRKPEPTLFAIQRTDGLFYSGMVAGAPRFEAGAERFESREAAEQELSAIPGHETGTYKIVELT
jgi:hypothetical protein